MIGWKENGMIIVDLDGTLLNNDKKIGSNDFNTLTEIGKWGIKRVIATGRSLFSALRVLDVHTPVDYLIFSSGAGIIDWNSNNLLFKSEIGIEKVNKVIYLLKNLKLNFSVHFPVPDNHKYYFWSGKKISPDFEQRNKIYSSCCGEMLNGFPFEKATQFVVILENEEEFNYVSSKIEDLKVIRATSPIDLKSVWLEIFNLGVSKADGAKFLCRKFGIKQKQTISIGNDYNDLDLLNWTSKSFVVNNAPEIIKSQFLVCNSNSENPLTSVIQQLSI
ncbi:MAG: HAD-IIB family hydrolase [Bacteroidales bacterium]